MTRYRFRAISSVLTVSAAVLVPWHPSPSTRAATAQTSPPEFARDVQPIVAQHCVSCHRDGGPAPFALATYRDIEKRAAQIAQITKAGYMPPWKPDSHGDLVGENRLTARDISVLQAWSDRPLPRGANHALRPSSTIWSKNEPEKFELGKPDAVLTPAAPCEIPASGRDFYRCFLLRTHFAEDKYLAAVVYQPGNQSVSDHALEYIDTWHKVRFLNPAGTGGSFTVQRSTAGLDPAMLVGGWGIATPTVRFPSGSGILLPRGADIVVQVHYHSTGKPEIDRPRVLLYFCRGPVTSAVHVAPVLAQNLRLLPRFSDIHVGGQSPVVSDITILGALPYMRRRGVGIALEALLPDKSRKTLLSIPQWDFDWVGDYRYRKPVHVPAGSLLTMVAGFNNAAPAGQSPSEDHLVTWGDMPEDENAVAYVFYTTGPLKAHPASRVPIDRRNTPSSCVPGIPALGAPSQAAMHRILLQMFDTNHDGTIGKSEYIVMRGYFRGGMPSMAGMEM